jgi:hypothetical protein
MFQALALEGKQTSLVAEYIMKVCDVSLSDVCLFALDSLKILFICVCPFILFAGLINFT